MATNNPVGWFEIYVKDMSRAKAFYEAVLAVNLDRLNSPDSSLEMYSFPMHADASGAAGALVKMEGGPAGGAGTIVYFTAEDCATEIGRVKSSGGSVMKDKFSIGDYGYIALGIDTEGNVIGFHSMR